MQLVEQHIDSDKEAESCFNVIIDMGNGVEETIVVHKEDIPKELAVTFCAKHGLGKEQEERLTTKISRCIDELLFDKYISEDANSKGLFTEDELNRSNSQAVGDEGIEESQENFSRLGQPAKVKQLSQISERGEERHKIAPTARMPSLRELNKGRLGNCVNVKDPSMYHHREQHSMNELNQAAIHTMNATDKKQVSLRKTKLTESLIKDSKAVKCTSFRDDKVSKGRRKVRSKDSKGFARSYCVNLYHTALARKKQKEKLAQETIQLKMKEELKNATFHPKITPSKYYKTSKKFQDRLYEYENLSQRKRRNMKLGYLAQENKECTFRPAIDKE
eukprot:TRINITY_DN9077_c0_g1_i4.p1 TRINITY_DN9077_c0_g1~~TRINITY_DN9077_c0_g1_i4.p1  ORF type:complete len:333 (-),score=69.48 TRINITY_DN9077_c0_g1_i4:726-1724(-)